MQTLKPPLFSCLPTFFFCFLLCGFTPSPRGCRCVHSFIPTTDLLSSFAMLTQLYCLTAALAVGALAQVIEPTDFNVTEALENLGVEVEELPIADLESRSTNAACAVAVSQSTPPAQASLK